MALKFNVVARDGRARRGELILPHGVVETPVFMPVGTKGAIKGVCYDDLESLGCVLSLGNTFHLAFHPGSEIIRKSGGLHKFSNSRCNFLTDSGGFQMVSLFSLSKVTEEGVEFKFPYDLEREIFLTPEESIKIQNDIGADIIMALDDVVSSIVRDKERLELATHRTTRWLDRCIKAHSNPETQALFAIVQGSIYPDLRRISLNELKKRDLPGYAIGGLSGGENKTDFWRIVELCTREEIGLPFNKPRYLMGVGYQIDLIVSVALGCDMFDCVFPTRTARFGTALNDFGNIRIQHEIYQYDFSPIDQDCDCVCCRKYSRAFLHYGLKKSILVSHLLTLHNIRYMVRLFEQIRESISEGNFKGFVRRFLTNMYINNGELPPLWVRDSLHSAGIDILDLYPDNSDVVKPY
ncbi:tRNA-guanine transglycosylase [Theileria parva strain Muguga]|uniref:Queuine tRNA-ribosyltransferase catalytic subunit 1 n=1 Tax=Theileria parva TaxID=5875 RepID=Q4N6U8_THEPA|nr:tRNA-guanine transglycosylase [Theileria parva strain Muguga]EAN34310.1 tRNA-guanine transglycosylase [Theileria parva strain Muguga]|eukprot:XP_766593.1 tRNA-guanine transglycosylase [Theileria parva strain Muguga]